MMTHTIAHLDEDRHARLLELPRMSTTLLEFVDPLFAYGDDIRADGLQALLEVGVLAWNSEESDDVLPEGWERRLPVGAGRGSHSAVPDLMAALVRRRREVFGDDPRSVGPPEVVSADGRPESVRVPVVDSPRLRRYLDAPSVPDRRAEVAPALADFLRRHRLDHRFVMLGIPKPFPASGFERRRLRVRWRGNQAEWNAPPLASLVRGDAVPPSDIGGSAFVRRYLPILATIETAVLYVARCLPEVPTDREVREAYRAVRRHAEGAVGGPVVDVVHQVVVLCAAGRRCSAGEVDAVLRHLERSVRLHERWPGGTEYLRFIERGLPAV